MVVFSENRDLTWIYIPVQNVKIFLLSYLEKKFFEQISMVLATNPVGLNNPCSQQNRLIGECQVTTTWSQK